MAGSWSRFNTLNTISALVESDPAATRTVVARLSELLRRTLDVAQQPEVRLADELQFIRGYLEIMKHRFSDRLTTSFAIEDGLDDALVPVFVLQPLVENAIEHGIGRIRGRRSARAPHRALRRSSPHHGARQRSGARSPIRECARRDRELAAVDYLMKPFDDARFDQAARRAHELIRLRMTDELRTQLVHLLAATDGKLAPHAPAQFIERIAVRERKEIRIVAVSEIDYITASGPYAEIHVAGEALLHRERMQSLEEVLDPARFCRIHRSAIVNLARVVAIEPQPSGDSSLRLRNGAVLRVSRARLAELNARLGIG